MVKGSDSKSDGLWSAGVQIPPVSFCFFAKKDTIALVAEWSKALRSGRSIFGCVGSNPTQCKFSGALAQSEECNVSNVKVPGSKPGCSKLFYFYEFIAFFSFCCNFVRIRQITGMVAQLVRAQVS